MGIIPRHPKKAIQLGEESLLQMNMSDAARYYEVSGDVVGKRLRPVERLDEMQLAFAMA
jgi:hypothetical protein